MCSARATVTLVLVCLSAVSVALARKDDKNSKAPKISKSVATKLNAAVVALRSGDSARLHKALAPVLLSSKPEGLAAANKFLRFHGIKQPIADLVAGARIDSVLGGQGRQIRRPGKAELIAVLPLLSQRIDELLKPIRAELAEGFRVQLPHEVIDEKVVKLPGLRICRPFARRSTKPRRTRGARIRSPVFTRDSDSIHRCCFDPIDNAPSNIPNDRSTTGRFSLVQDGDILCSVQFLIHACILQP